jgi:hypothetical protein
MSYPADHVLYKYTMTVEDFIDHANYMRDTDEYTSSSFTPAQLDKLHDLLNDSVLGVVQDFIEGLE